MGLPMRVMLSGRPAVVCWAEDAAAEKSRGAVVFPFTRYRREAVVVRVAARLARVRTAAAIMVMVMVRCCLSSSVGRRARAVVVESLLSLSLERSSTDRQLCQITGTLVDGQIIIPNHWQLVDGQTIMQNHWHARRRTGISARRHIISTSYLQLEITPHSSIILFHNDIVTMNMNNMNLLPRSRSSRSSSSSSREICNPPTMINSMLSLIIHNTRCKSQDSTSSMHNLPSDDDDGGESSFALKVMFVISILLTILCLLVLFFIYKYIRLYQKQRNDIFEEQSRFDQIDLLIHLICEQEKILEIEKLNVHESIPGETDEAKVAVGMNRDVIRRYNQLNEKFYNELDILHEMMSRNDLELKIQKKGMKIL